MSDVLTRLREARERAGLSQGEVARRMGLHRPTITAIESDRRALRFDEAVAFAQLYGVTLEWLAKGNRIHWRTDCECGRTYWVDRQQWVERKAGA